MTKKAHWKNHLKLALKTAFVVGLLYFLAHKGFLSMKDTGRALTQWQYILPAFGLLFVNNLLGAYRWKLLLDAQGLPLGFGRILQLLFVGNFFNVALPGAVSGDFVKAFYIGREMQGKRAKAFGSILFDRVAGLSGLVLIAASALILGWDQFHDSVLLKSIQSFVLIAAACVIAFYGYLFVVQERHDPVMMIMRKLEALHPKFGSLARIYESLRHYHHHKITVLKVLALSMVIHSIVGFSFLNFGFAIGEQNLTLLAVYVVMALGLIITTIPIAPAGVGTGHAAFLYLFHLIGSERGADVFTLFVIGTLIWGAIGGIVYLRFKSEIPMPDAEKAGTPELA